NTWNFRALCDGSADDLRWGGPMIVSITEIGNRHGKLLPVGIEAVLDDLCFVNFLPRVVLTHTADDAERIRRSCVRARLRKQAEPETYRTNLSCRASKRSWKY